VTPADRERAIAYLEQTKTAVLDSTAALDEAQWRFKPSPETWSPAECIEHVAIVETELLRRIQELAQGPAAPDEILAQTPGKEETMVKMVRSRARKVSAPEGARPTNRFSSSAELRAHFVEVRERTIVYVRTTEDPIRQRTYDHFVLGPLDCYQWILFLAAHSERHLKQLEEVLAS
jgi:hypothetical protein